VFAEQIEQLIPNILGRDVDYVAKTLWQAFSAGQVTDDEAGRLAMLIEARRGVARASGSPVGAFKPIAFTPRRPQRSPDQRRSLLRRRQLAAAGPLPPHLAAGFTTGELSVLAVIASEVRQQGTCDRSIDELAARAGVSRATVQRAVRAAVFGGLITKEERPRRGQKSLTNVIRIVSREWLAWIRRGPRRPIAGDRVSVSQPHGQQRPESEAVKQWKSSQDRGQKGGAP
jgi:hypothetical protein